MKQLRCRDAGFDCDAVVQADSVADVLTQASDHAEQAHRVHMTPQLREQLETLVRDA